MPIVVVQKLNNKYFTTVQSCLYISVIIILNIKKQNLIKF